MRPTTKIKSLTFVAVLLIAGNGAAKAQQFQWDGSGSPADYGFSYSGNPNLYELDTPAGHMHQTTDSADGGTWAQTLGITRATGWVVEWGLEIVSGSVYKGIQITIGDDLGSAVLELGDIRGQRSYHGQYTYWDYPGAGQHVYKFECLPNDSAATLYIDGSSEASLDLGFTVTDSLNFGNGAAATEAYYDFIQVAALGDVVFVDDFSWQANQSGDWNDSTNWSPSGGPPGTAASDRFSNHTATFGSAIESAQTVFTNTPVSVQAITFDNDNSYIVAGASSVSLVQGTAEGKTGNSSITVAQGTHEFQLRVNLENHTDVNVATNSTLEFNNRLFLNSKTLTKTGSGNVAFNNNVLTGGGTVNCAEGDCTGTGTISGDLNNSGGTVSPGNSPGVIEVTGDFTQGNDGTLLIELAGTEAGAEHDLLKVAGEASLDGTLEVSLLEGFEPAASDSFDIFDFGSVTGNFDEVILPDLGGSLAWDDSTLLSHGSLSVVPEPNSSFMILMGIMGLFGCRRLRPGNAGRKSSLNFKSTSWMAAIPSHRFAEFTARTETWRSGRCVCAKAAVAAFAHTHPLHVGFLPGRLAGN